MNEPIVEGGSFLMEGLTTVVTSLMNSIVSVWTTIVSQTEIMPFFLLGIGISLVLVAVKVIKTVVWGA